MPPRGHFLYKTHGSTPLANSLWLFFAWTNTSCFVLSTCQLWSSWRLVVTGPCPAVVDLSLQLEKKREKKQVLGLGQLDTAFDGSSMGPTPSADAPVGQYKLQSFLSSAVEVFPLMVRRSRHCKNCLTQSLLINWPAKQLSALITSPRLHSTWREILWWRKTLVVSRQCFGKVIEGTLPNDFTVC